MDLKFIKECKQIRKTTNLFSIIRILAYVEKNRTPQRTMSVKINLLLRYPDS